MAERRTEPRFPGVEQKRGHYESFFVRAFHPAQPLGLWIRHTVIKRPGSPPRGSVWFTLFDQHGEGITASKATLEPGDLSAPDGAYIRIGDTTFAPGEAVGGTDSAAWRLSFESERPPLRHLPREWMYGAPVPRTKLLAPYPAARYSGEVTVGGRRIDVDGWPGTVGHNWGAQHAERWIWIHGARFDGDAAAWIDLGIGRIKLGPVTTPWVVNGALELDGERVLLGGLGARGTSIDERPDGCRFTIPGGGLTVRGEVGAARDDFVGWLYSDPDGSEHNVVNCSIAGMELTVERDGRPPLHLRTDHGAAYELGMREKDHGIPIQPFPDP